MSMKKPALVSLFSAIVLIAGAIWYGLSEMQAGNYSASLIAVAALGTLAVCLLFGQRWAAQATAMLLILANLLAVFEFFPPFGDEVHPALSMTARVVALMGISVLCMGLSVGLYFRQRLNDRT
jgi:hypothetical protein